MNKPSRYTPVLKTLTGPEANFISKLSAELAQRESEARFAKATLRQALAEIQTLQNLKIFGLILTHEDRKAMERTELHVRKRYREAAAALIETRARHNEAVRRICEAKLARNAASKKHGVKPAPKHEVKTSGNKTIQLDGESYELIKDGYFSVDFESAKELFVKLHKAIGRLEENPQLRMIVHFQSK